MNDKFLIDKLLIIYISTALSFFISISKSFSETLHLKLLYVITGYSTIGVISFLIIMTLGKRRHTPAKKFSPIIIIIIFCMIEYIHFFKTGLSLGGLTDIRMVLYNPMYSTILVFAFYGTYLLLSHPVVRNFHLQFSIKFFSWFNLFFIFYWILLFFGLVPSIEDANNLNNNHISYVALLIIYFLMIRKNTIQINDSLYKLFLYINISVIFLNSTRGAILILMCIFIYLMNQWIYKKLNRVYFVIVLLLSVFVITVAHSGNLYMKFVGEDLFDVFEIITNSRHNDNSYKEIRHIYQHKQDANKYSGASLSSASRLYTNVMGYNLFKKNSILGVGTARAYSIKILTTGIHSFTLLLLVSVGLVGTILLGFSIKLLINEFGVIEKKYLIYIYGFLLFLFINNFPYYLVLLIVNHSRSNLDITEAGPA
jgi:hypothetical protein